MALRQEIIQVLDQSSIWKLTRSGIYTAELETAKYRIKLNDEKETISIEKYVVIPASDIRSKPLKKWLVLSSGTYGQVFLEPGKIKIGRDRQFNL